MTDTWEDLPEFPPMLTRQQSRASTYEESPETAASGWSRIKCIYCKRDFESDVSYKTACLECYKQHIKKCQCGKNLRLNAPTYQNKCTQCWLDGRRETHDKCPFCVGAAAGHLRRKIGCAMCSDCLQKKQTKQVPRSS